MKRILIIGGSYFAGRVFVEELAASGSAEIHVFNRGRIPLGIAGVTEHVGDREIASQIGTAIPSGPWDAVVDFCAYEPLHVGTMLENLPGRVGHYLLISTTSVYARTTRLPVTEEAPLLTGPQEALGQYRDYGYHKLLTEQRLAEECRRRDIPFTILRPSIIYGYYNYAPRESHFFDLLCDKKPIIIPEPDLALFSFIWVVDLARIIVRCLGEARTFGEAYNVASDELISYGRIADVLSEITGKALDIVRMTPSAIEGKRIAMPFPIDEHLVYGAAKLARIVPIASTPFNGGMREALKYHLMVRRRAAAQK